MLLERTTTTCSGRGQLVGCMDTSISGERLTRHGQMLINQFRKNCFNSNCVEKVQTLDAFEEECHVFKNGREPKAGFPDSTSTLFS